MKGKKALILGLVAIATGIIYLFSPNPVRPQAEAAVLVNTCTTTYQLVGRAPVVSGMDTVAINVTPSETGPVSWIVNVNVQVTVTETQVVLTFGAETGVLRYEVIKALPDGNTQILAVIIPSDTSVPCNATYTDTNILGDTVYYYAVRAVGTSTGNTGVLSDSVAVGVTADGIIFSPTTKDSTTISVVCRDDNRVFVRIPAPDTTFGAEQDMLKLVIRRIPRAQLPVPSWAKKGVSSAYEVYCRKLTTQEYITQFAAPIELTFAYDIVNGKVEGTGVNVADILARLSNFRWTGGSWSRIPSSIDLLLQTVWSQTTRLSYFAVGDLRALVEPKFPYCGAEPNPFTPNGDRYNEVVYCKFPNDNHEKGTFKVFDLNGAVVYEEEIEGLNYAIWDGKYNVGKTELAEAGVYIWQAKIGTSVYNGIVVLAK